jgi:arginyl-tRNA synthetase
VKKQIESLLQTICKKLYGVDVDVNLVRPDNKFGDYATYVSFDLSPQLHKSPKEIAKQIADEIKSDLISKSEVAGPGFINVYLSDSALAKAYKSALVWDKINSGKEQLVEFGDPNPFKEMHLGHLYSSVVGDSIASLLESSGSDAKRLSYHGDIGLHVAKWIWAVGQETNWNPEKLINEGNNIDLGAYYVKGAKAFEEDKKAEAQIREINEHIYKRDKAEINEIYELGKEVSFKKFDEIFKRIGVHFDKRYLESQSAEIGLKIVNENVGEVFSKSDGAVIYKGEEKGLHTRVFVNSRGLPTYETKELGLTVLKDKDYPKADLSIIITANEQAEYFKVVLAALSEINPDLAKKTEHITHGFLSLSSGKMSSRTGDVYSAEKLLDDLQAAVKKQYPDTKVKDDIFKSALRYTFLKQKIGNDIVFDTNESVSLEGNSGPYIQYAYARAQSILEKVKSLNPDLKGSLKVEDVPLQPAERDLAVKISEYPEVVERTLRELMPHYICTYLYELAQEFNRFYEANRIIGDPRIFTRLELVKTYAKVLENGLQLLNIPTPVHM